MTHEYFLRLDKRFLKETVYITSIASSLNNKLYLNQFQYLFLQNLQFFLKNFNLLPRWKEESGFFFEQMKEIELKNDL